MGEEDRDVVWTVTRLLEAERREADALAAMSDHEVADQLESWAKPFDAMMRPGFKHDRAELLRDVAARLRRGEAERRQLDLWSSRAQAATEDVGALTEELARVRSENEHLLNVRLRLRSALLTIAHARDDGGRHLHELLARAPEQHVLETLEATRDP